LEPRPGRSPGETDPARTPERWPVQGSWQEASLHHRSRRPAKALGIKTWRDSSPHEIVDFALPSRFPAQLIGTIFLDSRFRGRPRIMTPTAFGLSKFDSELTAPSDPVSFASRARARIEMILSGSRGILEASKSRRTKSACVRPQGENLDPLGPTPADVPGSRPPDAVSFGVMALSCRDLLAPGEGGHRSCLRLTVNWRPPFKNL